MEFELYNGAELVEKETLDNSMAIYLFNEKGSFISAFVDSSLTYGSGTIHHIIKATNMNVYEKDCSADHIDLLYEINAPVTVESTYISDNEEQGYLTMNLTAELEHQNLAFKINAAPEVATNYLMQITEFNNTKNPETLIEIMSNVLQDDNAFFKEAISIDYIDEEQADGKRILLGIGKFHHH